MGKILIGSILAFIAFVDYCCCRAASLAEKRMESLFSMDRRDAK